LDIRASIVLNSFSSGELSFLDPVHELSWTTSLVGNFINFTIKEILFHFLDSSSEFLLIIQTSQMLVSIKVSVTIIIPPDFEMPCNVDFLGVLMPYIVDDFFKNIDINNRISLEVFYEIFQFSNKLIFLLAILDENVL